MGEDPTIHDGMTDDDVPAVAPLLDRIAAAGYDEVPVVNAVADPAPVPLPPLSGGGDRALRKALRQAARVERRRRRHPEKYRVDFTAWVGIPWRDRPIEARLADFAEATAGAVLRSAAWRHPLLEGHRLRLDPAREAADIAVNAYRIYCARRDLGAPPSRRFGQLPASEGALGDAVHASYQEKSSALDAAWQALVQRLAAFDGYRRHLDEMAPVLAAADTVQHLDGAHFGQQVAQIVSGGAQDEFAASDTSALAYEAEALTQVLNQAQRGGSMQPGVVPPARQSALPPAPPPQSSV